jgi:hypothetical protein
MESIAVPWQSKVQVPAEIVHENQFCPKHCQMSDDHGPVCQAQMVSFDAVQWHELYSGHN